MSVSKPSSKTNTQNTQIDRRIGVTDQGTVLVAEGEGSSITLTDGGAFDKAFGGLSEGYQKALEFAGAQSDVSRSASESQIFKLALYGGVALGALMIFMRAKG